MFSGDAVILEAIAAGGQSGIAKCALAIAVAFGPSDHEVVRALKDQEVPKGCPGLRWPPVNCEPRSSLLSNTGKAPPKRAWSRQVRQVRLGLKGRPQRLLTRIPCSPVDTFDVAVPASI